MSKVQLTLLASQVIADHCWYGENGLFTKDGRILVSVTARSESQNGHINLYSADGGNTWKTVDNVLGGYHCKELHDGSIIGFSKFNEILEKIPAHQHKKPYVMGVRRAASLDALLAGDYEDDFISMDIPDLSMAFGDESNPCCGVVDHGIVELPNGDLVITMYGHFYEDQVLIEFFSSPTRQYRTWIMVSRDGGHTFQYLSTVADPQTWPIGPTGEGYCEADLLRVQDGRLLCALRSGGAFSKGREDYCDLVLCISQDGGITWSKPERIYDFGVFPQMVQTQNGAVVLTSGRDGMYLTASADGGASWQEPEIMDGYVGRFGYSSSGYGCIGEVAPNEIVVIYDEIADPASLPALGSEEDKAYVKGSMHHMVARRYRVEMV